jgi:hypothetical protein
MSLLDTGTEDVIVFPEEMVVDGDGNKMTRPSATGIPARARIQPIGTPTETAEGGFNTVSRYSLRFPHSFTKEHGIFTKEHGILGAQSQIEWNGKRYSIFGDAMIYNGSRRTAHVDYVMVRK